MSTNSVNNLSIHYDSDSTNNINGYYTSYGTFNANVNTTISITLPAGHNVNQIILKNQFYQGEYHSLNVNGETSITMPLIDVQYGSWTNGAVELRHTGLSTNYDPQSITVTGVDQNGYFTLSYNQNTTDTLNSSALYQASFGPFDCKTNTTITVSLEAGHNVAQIILKNDNYNGEYHTINMNGETSVTMPLIDVQYGEWINGRVLLLHNGFPNYSQLLTSVIGVNTDTIKSNEQIILDLNIPNVDIDYLYNKKVFWPHPTTKNDLGNNFLSIDNDNTLSAIEKRTKKTKFRHHIVKTFFVHPSISTIPYTREALGFENDSGVKSNVVLIDTDDTVFSMQTLTSDSSFYCPIGNGQNKKIEMIDGNILTFSRQDVNNEEQYTISFESSYAETVFEKVSGCANLSDIFSTSISGYLTPGDEFAYFGQIFIVGSLTSGGTTTNQSSICLLQGTMIKIDGIGEVPIERVRSGMKIAGYEIKGLSKGTCGDKIVKINKGTFGKNLPNKDTFMTPGHSILVDNKLIASVRLVNKVNNINIIDYSLKTETEKQVYNILCSKWITMTANGIPVETLHPKYDKNNTIYMF